MKDNDEKNRVADENAADPIIRHIPRAEVFRLAGETQYRTNQIVSETLVQNDAVGLTLFAFDKGTEISEHQSNGDALVGVLEGVGAFKIGGVERRVAAGESLLMPARVPHSVSAPERFKAAILVVF